ncbi:MAG TPA: hypothetical protein VI299_00345 [Polyangiales bacterium]
MSMRTLFTVVTLSCALAACDEEGPEPSPDDDDPEFETDASSPMGRVDGGIKIPSTPSSSDAGLPRGNDAGIITGGGNDASAPSEANGAAKFFLPTIEPNNTSAPTVEVDAQGNTHMIYPAYVRGGAYYATCAKGKCTSDDDVEVAKFETDGTVGNAMIALTADGKPRILLSTFAYVYYGECDTHCGQRDNWKLSMILKHDNDKDITGEAFTLDNQGHPRFLIHTYRALFGIGQKPAKVELAQCDSNCTESASWKYDTIAAPAIWYGSTLRYDAQGHIHVATNVIDYAQENPAPTKGAYLVCTTDCSNPDSWNGVSFLEPYESSTEAVSMNPAVGLALTKSAQPRFVQINKDPEGKKTVSYFTCDADCTKGSSWVYAWSFKGDNVDSGIDIALDAQDHPRIVHTVNYNIAISYCDDADCSTTTSKWDSKLVESGGEIPPDNIFLEWNCTIGAWFLHDPSIAIGSDGKPVIGYQARDISGGFSVPDPTKPRCVAGTDMTWSRLAVSDTAY